MSRFSQAEAEAAGWSIVHKRDEYEVTVGPGLVQKHPATIVAEKYVSRPGEVGRFLHEEAETMGKLLERIHAWEQHQKNIDAEGQNAQPFEADLSAEVPQFSPLYDDEPGDSGKPAQNVVIPTEPGDLTFEADVETITDAEWSLRGRADTLVTDEGQVIYRGGGENVANAEELRLLNKKAIEDRRAAEPAHGPVEQVEFDTAGIADTPGIGAGGTLIVREGEGPGDVIARKEELKKMREEGRVSSAHEQGEAVAPEGADKLAGLDVGIQERGDLASEMPPQGSVARTLEEPESEQEEHPAPHLYPEGEPIEIDPEDIPEEPASAVEADARNEAEEEAALEARDEGLVEAESDEAKNEVREAGIEAAEEAQEEFKDEVESEESDAVEPESAAGMDNEAHHPDANPARGEPAVEVTPAAEELAKEKGVDLSKVEGSGKDGKIIKPDVEAVVEQDE